MNAVTSEAEGADTLKLLLEKGADPNAEMTEGERPLDWAIYKGDKAKIQVLEQFGAMRGRDRDGRRSRRRRLVESATRARRSLGACRG